MRRAPLAGVVPAALLATLLVVACDHGGDGITGAEADAATRLTLRARVPSGEEQTWCQYVLPAQETAEGLSIQAITHASEGAATHHVIWYQMAETPASVADRMAPFRCDDGVHLRKIGVLYAPPAANGGLRWADGVAAHLAPDAVTLVEWHVINYWPEDVDATVTLDVSAPKEPTSLRAGTLLLYDWFVHLPPGARHTSRTRCRVPADITLTWASQHMHQRGVGFTAELYDVDGSYVRELLVSDRWDADPRVYEREIPLRRGQWIEYACRYDNPDSYSVIEGDGVDDEMCMFVGGYYPQIDVPLGETCQIGHGSGPVFSGEATCAQSLDCMGEASERAAVHACWNGTREAESGALVDLAWRCASARCPQACGREGVTAECMQCLAMECAEELDACNAGE